MANWVKCNTMDGGEVRVNMDHIAMIRPHNQDRGGTGSEITFAGGAPSSIVVKQDQEYLTERPQIESRRVNF